MESIWKKDTKIGERPALFGEYNADVVVIGGGMAGILTAYFLWEKGMDVVVLEADRIGSGQTGNTTAKITSQHDLIYHKLLQDYGRERAGQYAEANERAIGEYRRVIQRREIDCFFEERPAYLYSTSYDDVPALEREAAAANRLGIDAEFTYALDLPFPVKGAVKFGGQAQFHPLKFLQGIAQKLTIFEHTRVKDVEGTCVLTDGGRVQAKHVVFATHFPFLNAPGCYFLRMHQERSYVVALENAGVLPGMYLGVDREALSLRNFGSLLLLGGGGHRTGDNKEGGKYAFLRKTAAQLYGESREAACWSAQDCTTIDGLPYIGPFAPSVPHWYVATGFGKWGMTTSMVSAMILSDMIAGEKNLYQDIFSPRRFKAGTALKGFFSNTGWAVKGLTKQLFAGPSAQMEALLPGEGGVVEYEGKKTGVYKDEKGNIFALSTRCPHLGCQLEWNPDEKTWDCPCHGSRFDHTGRLLNNPAEADLKKRHVAFSRRP